MSTVLAQASPVTWGWELAGEILPRLLEGLWLVVKLTLIGIVMAMTLGLGIHYATYTSEAYRSGIDNVDRGQWEAATAVSMGCASLRGDCGARRTRPHRVQGRES
ncbi:MAG: hypothetical protein ACR2HM_04455 [Acidimicrobiales bacterium]